MNSMLHPSLRWAVGIAMILALASGPTRADDKPLTGAEIKSTFTGARTTRDVPNGGVFQIDFKADGSMDGSIIYSANGRTLNDRGTWRVDGDKLCRKWQRFGEGRDDCFSITMNGGVTAWQGGDGSSLSWRLSK